ncbi:hypothetical protein CLIB1444_02S02432 [[Candida] jaroonii]|uniref:Uncharacterized protein n=1 Tax=[Candida] jaroonii TaxID=467808 RepID=A0ACA9Y2K4_9ASCO|nr:hypothetical protein CLIB1444_02S02432 [[Candida] jaroonii]
MFKRCLSYRKNYFSHNLVHNEVFRRRVNEFNRGTDKLSPNQKSLLLIDCIRAGRTLQLKKRPTMEILDIESSSNQQLETLISDTLINNQPYLNDDVIRTYLLTYPRPVTASNIITLIESEFQRKLQNNIIDNSIIRLGVNRFLEMNDYMNCFNVFDRTFRSSQYQRLITNQIRRSIAYFTTSIGGIVGLLTMCEVPFEISLPLTLISGLGTAFTYLNVKYPRKVGRLSWRFSNSLSYNISNSQELFFLNRIINYFEEYNEINLLNYHHSKVRNFNDIKVNKLDDFIIEEPEDPNQYFITNPRLSEMYVYFKDQLKHRKVAIGDLPQELAFMEYWQYNENFEWVEPDQDPAELMSFQIHHSNLIQPPLVSQIPFQSSSKVITP